MVSWNKFKKCYEPINLIERFDEREVETILEYSETKAFIVRSIIDDMPGYFKARIPSAIEDGFSILGKNEVGGFASSSQPVYMLEHICHMFNVC